MDDHLSRNSHGSYGGRAPLDYGVGGSGGTGLLIAVVVLGAIVVGSFFIGTGSGPSQDGGTVPAVETGAPAPAAQD
jgi:hypothetical protein